LYDRQKEADWVNRQLGEMTEQWKTIDARLEELKVQEEQLTFSVDARITEIQV